MEPSQSKWKKVKPDYSETLKDYFSKFGPIDFFKLGRNKKTQEPLGFAFVEFKDQEVAKKILKIKHFIHGREVVSSLLRLMSSNTQWIKRSASSNKKLSKERSTSKDSLQLVTN